MDRETVGTWRGVAVDVVGWDGVDAAVDLSCACMFEREVSGKAMAGGLLHLDDTLGNALSKLRSEAVFVARPMETVLITTPPAPVAAAAVLVIGLGDPQRWKPSTTARAVAVAVQMAVQQGAHTVAFAPSLLDAGLAGTADTPAVMASALTSTLDAIERLAGLGLIERPRLKRWTFDAGIAHLGSAAAAFRSAFSSIKP